MTPERTKLLLEALENYLDEFSHLQDKPDYKELESIEQELKQSLEPGAVGRYRCPKCGEIEPFAMDCGCDAKTYSNNEHPMI